MLATTTLTKETPSNGKKNGSSEVDTVCSFCGKGEACIKGREGWRYMYSDRRLTRPLIRKNGELVSASWEEALDLVASRLSEIKDESGPDSFGVFSSSRSTNELNYLASKFTRSVLGTNNVDSCNRA